MNFDDLLGKSQNSNPELESVLGKIENAKTNAMAMPLFNEVMLITDSMSRAEAIRAYQSKFGFYNPYARIHYEATDWKGVGEKVDTVITVCKTILDIIVGLKEAADNIGFLRRFVGGMEEAEEYTRSIHGLMFRSAGMRGRGFGRHRVVRKPVVAPVKTEGIMDKLRSVKEILGVFVTLLSAVMLLKETVYSIRQYMDDKAVKQVDKLSLVTSKMVDDVERESNRQQTVPLV